MSGYKSAAAILLSLIVFFTVLNLLAYSALIARDFLKVHGGDRIPNNPWALRAKIYPDLSQEDIYQLFMETWEWRGFEYSPLAQFHEEPYEGKFVNVTENGYRKGKQDNPWPPSEDRFNLFVFGGSTTFGYGLPDWQTIPSYLQDLLAKDGRKAAVYNFGHSTFYSTHELLEFQRLLMEGFKPDAAVFIDGLNEFYSYDAGLLWTERIKDWEDQRKLGTGNALRYVFDHLPITELTTFLLRYFGTSGRDLQEKAQENVRKILEGGGGGEKTKLVLDRYVKNRALIKSLAEHFNVLAYFVWQPIVAYKYNLENHLFAYREMRQHTESGQGYRYAARQSEEGPFGRDLIWCADIQEGVEKPLYVDAVHYNAELSEMLAQCIIDKSGLSELIAPRISSLLPANSAK